MGCGLRQRRRAAPAWRSRSLSRRWRGARFARRCGGARWRRSVRANSAPRSPSNPAASSPVQQSSAALPLGAAAPFRAGRNLRASRGARARLPARQSIDEGRTVARGSCDYGIRTRGGRESTKFPDLRPAPGGYGNGRVYHGLEKLNVPPGGSFQAFPSSLRVPPRTRLCFTAVGLGSNPNCPA